MVNDQESITAKLCSFARAFHSNYGDNKIYDDYLAFDLMGKKQYEEMGQLIENGFDAAKFDNKKWFNQKRIHDAVYTYMLPIPLSRISFAGKELEAFRKKYGGSGKKIQYVMVGDANWTLAKNFDVLIEADGLADRGTFVIDPEGKIQIVEINAGGIGRDAQELLRKVKAAQYVHAHPGEVCPAKWKEGDATLAPSIDLVGKI